MKFFKFNLGPVARISLGLIAILVGWLLLLELLIGIWPNQDLVLEQLHKKTAENLAINTSILLRTQDYKGIKKLLEDAVVIDQQIVSGGLRLKNGTLVVQTSNHLQVWKGDSNKSTADFVKVQLKADKKPWGDLELVFKPNSPDSFLAWFKQPSVIGLILAVLGCLIFYMAYLKNIFRYLDPSAVIPDRVRAAFDSFSEGVMMIDRTGHVVLVNNTLREWLEDGSDVKYFGKHITTLPWIKTFIANMNEKHPWTQAMDSQEVINGWRLDIKQNFDNTIKAVMSCSPIRDPNGSIRGCLITIDNITAIEALNNELKSTNDELQQSRAELDRQNEVLRNLAARDPMTNCLNRRSFYDLAEDVFAKAKKSELPMCCVMTDIDFFKRVNDNYGHAVGDKVIISVARTLFSGLRAEDLFCRYGGEEFCILLPEVNMDIAFKLADRLRKEIEAKVGPSVRTVDGMKVTSSFGLATLNAQTTTLSELIDHADQALYKAKEAGRNRVEIYTSNLN